LRSRNPVRVVFDTHLRIPEGTRLLREEGRTIIFIGEKRKKKKEKWLLERFSSVEIVSVPRDATGHVSLSAALEWLENQGIASVMVEGGAKTALSFIAQNLADKVIFIFTPHISASLSCPRMLDPALAMNFIKQAVWRQVDADLWGAYYPPPSGLR